MKPNKNFIKSRLKDSISSSTYEDSLKEEFATETTTTSTTTRIALAQRTSFRQKILENLDRQVNRHSFSGFHQMERQVKNSRRSSFMIAGNNNNPHGFKR